MDMGAGIALPAPRPSLIDSEFEPRLSDFGIAKLLSSDTSSWTAVVGSYDFMALNKS